MAAAISRQLIEDVAPAWRISVPSVVAAPSLPAAPHDAIIFSFVEKDESTPGAGGWHTEDQTGRIYAEVLISPYLDNGGSLMSGPNSISQVASHEAIETLLDPFCVLYALGPDSRFYPVEGCDAVQGFSYVKGGVAVSDFLLPSFFDAESTDPHGDFLSKGAGPFKTSPSGYQAILDPHELTDATEDASRVSLKRFSKAIGNADFDPKHVAEFGAGIPDWLVKHKLATSTRLRRRLGARKAVAT
jgi:hypothetical protein